jgi:hypothetical protein
MFAMVAALSLATSTAAFAQSHQGGYLGLNPAGQQTAAAVEQPRESSHQGGYLGVNPGARRTPAKPAAPTLADELADPLAWCTTSKDPGHCRPNAAGDHKICVADPQHYDSCRYAMSQMFHN